MKLPLKVRCALLVLMLAACGHTAHRDAQGQSSQRRQFADLTHNVNAIKFSPDGRLLAIARGVSDNRVELWDTETGALQRTIRGFDGPVWSVSFSPDGHILLTGSSGFRRARIAEKKPSANGTAFVELKWWDSQTGEFKQRLEIPRDDLLSVAATYSPDGKFLAAIDQSVELLMMVLNHRQPSDFSQSATVFRFRDFMNYRPTLKLLDARTGETILKLKDGFEY